MLLRINELKKAFGRFYERQPFKGYLFNDESNLFISQVSNDFHFAYLVENADYEDAEDHLCVELNSSQLKQLSEYFKTIRVRRNCRLTVNDAKLIIEIQSKDEASFDKGFEMDIQLAENIDEAKELLLTAMSKELFNVKDFVYFTKFIASNSKTNFIPASEYASVVMNKETADIYYGYHDTVAKLSVPCETNVKDRKETIRQEFLLLANKFFKETLAKNAQFVFKKGYVGIISESFVLFDKLIFDRPEIQYDQLYCSLLKTCSNKKQLPQGLLQKLTEIKKNETVQYLVSDEKSNEAYYEIYGKKVKLVKGEFKTPINKCKVYFDQNSEQYVIISEATEIADIWPSGRYISASLVMKFNECEEALYSTDKSGALIVYYGKGTYILLPSVL